MSSNRKTTDFLKECMADALLRHMRTRHLDKITIEDIVELAGVGRSTYFRNFTSKEEMITFKYVKLWEHWKLDHPIDDEHKFSLATSQYIFEFFYNVRDTTKIVYKAGLSQTLFEAIYEIITTSNEEASEEDTTMHYVKRCYAHATWGLIDEWIKRDYEETVEQMVDIVCNHLFTN